MEICECKNPRGKHHPSLHYAEKRNALMRRVGKFMRKVYPTHIFGKTFNRQQVELITACFVLDEILAPQSTQGQEK